MAPLQLPLSFTYFLFHALAQQKSNCLFPSVILLISLSRVHYLLPSSIPSQCIVYTSSAISAAGEYSHLPEFFPVFKYLNTVLKYLNIYLILNKYFPVFKLLDPLPWQWGGL